MREHKTATENVENDVLAGVPVRFDGFRTVTVVAPGDFDAARKLGTPAYLTETGFVKHCDVAVLSKHLKLERWVKSPHSLHFSRLEFFCERCEEWSVHEPGSCPSCNSSVTLKPLTRFAILCWLAYIVSVVGFLLALFGPKIAL